jgi:phosphatidylglycerophosphate synthase
MSDSLPKIQPQVVDAVREAPLRAPGEAWILAGTLDGVPATPSPMADVCGMPHLLRLACAAEAAGVERILVVWNGPEVPPDLSQLAQDERLRGRTLRLVTTPPDAAGADDDAILVVRADRVFHRDLPKTLARAASRTRRAVLELQGQSEPFGSALIARRTYAGAIARVAADAGGLAALIHSLRRDDEVAQAEPPWGAFETPARDARALAAAERRMLVSLRKPQDGIASKYVNRYVSLFLTLLLMRTGVRPNHISMFNLLVGVAGGVVCGFGGWLAGVIGMLLVELGSIVDGTDGELARLQYRPSKLGEWLDTLSDDLANISILIGLGLNLSATVSWAMPAAMAAVGAFAVTQTVAYWMMARVIRSGDLMSFWGDSANGGTTPFMRALWVVQQIARRDFFVSVYVVLALIGRLDVALALTTIGAFAVLAKLPYQVVKKRRAATAG